MRRLFAFAACIGTVIFGSSALFAAGQLDPALPVYHVEQAGEELPKLD